MNNLKEYIVEKLKINKDTIVDTNDTIYVVLYSDNGIGIIKYFDTYKEATDFTEKTKFIYYDGYKTPKELKDELTQLLCDCFSGDKKYDELKKFVEKHKLEKIWNSLLSTN